MAKFNIRDTMTWFRNEFGNEIQSALVGTPFDLDLLTAIAYQETGYLVSQYLEQQLGRGDVLRLCVGDSLDYPNRKAFPRTKAALMAWSPHGPGIFSVAREALLDMAAQAKGYSGAAKNPNKFCHGFGIFQYDLQHCKLDPEYFLHRKWHSFQASLDKCVQELKAAQSRVPAIAKKKTLTEDERIMVAIAYNRGSYNPNKRLKQGHFDGSKYYGEYIFDYIQIAKTLPTPPPAKGPRLIVAKHPDASASAFAYAQLHSAEFKSGRFTVDYDEAAAWLGIPSKGGRALIKDILTNANLAYTVSEKHKKDPVNPRVYVFVGKSSEI